MARVILDKIDAIKVIVLMPERRDTDKKIIDDIRQIMTAEIIDQMAKKSVRV